MIRSEQTGFTFIELLITIGVAAFLIAVAVPSFVSTVENGRMTTQVNDFVSSLHLARSEAIKRRVSVTLCPSPDPLAAAATCSGTIEGGGWIVFVDDGGDGPGNNIGVMGQRDAAEQVLYGTTVRSDNLSLAFQNTLPSTFSYAANGFPRDTAGAAVNGAVLICDGRGDAHGRVVMLPQTGRPQTVRVAASTFSCGS